MLAAAGVHVERGALQRLGELVPGDGPVALVSDPHVAGIHGMRRAARARLAPRRDARAAAGRGGEDARRVSTASGRTCASTAAGTIVALGGGCTTDAAGFAAATYLRGIPWVPVPTSLVAQVDAAIGGKTAIDLPQGKNLVGAFHWPARTVIDPALLETLPEPQRLEGMAEVVKTGLLAGEPLWELPDDELVRRCAAFKAAVCLRDPRGARASGRCSTSATRSRTRSRPPPATKGSRTAAPSRSASSPRCASPAATRPSSRSCSSPQPVRVDRDRAWEALLRDKKTRGGELRLVLLGDDGPRRTSPCRGTSAANSIG